VNSRVRAAANLARGHGLHLSSPDDLTTFQQGYTPVVSLSGAIYGHMPQEHLKNISMLGLNCPPWKNSLLPKH